MVMQFGMSRLGRVNYKESVRSPFMGGGDGLGGPMHSEQTAHEIDLEVKQIIDDALSKVRHILSSRRETLLALSQRLVKCEVMDADELREIVDQTSSSPKIVPGTESADFKTAAPDQEEVPGADAPAVEDKTKRSGKGTA
jgi:cell division protease FtsH